MDRSEYLKEIKENIEYHLLCQQFNPEDVDEVVGLMADTMCSTQPTVRIGGENIPLPQVQAPARRCRRSGSDPASPHGALPDPALWDR